MNDVNLIQMLRADIHMRTGEQHRVPQGTRIYHTELKKLLTVQPCPCYQCAIYYPNCLGDVAASDVTTNGSACGAVEVKDEQ